jgi:hypothetical protein
METMAPKTQRFLFSFGSILILVISTFVLSAQTVEAASFVAAGRDLPALVEFAHQLENGHPGQLRGVYAAGLFAHVVVQQPADNPTFVSPRKSILTQFSSASDLGSTGLLAHNYLAGTAFGRIRAGQILYLIYGDGRTQRYSVRQLFRYQARQPESEQSDFTDLENGTHLTSYALFRLMYGRPGALVLQTCIAADGIDSWGRLFVIAEPAAPQKTTRLALSGP